VRPLPSSEFAIIYSTSEVFPAPTLLSGATGSMAVAVLLKPTESVDQAARRRETLRNDTSQ
jgi:hypothetical protein